MFPSRSTQRGRRRPATRVFGRTRSPLGNPGSRSGGGIYAKPGLRRIATCGSLPWKQSNEVRVPAAARGRIRQADYTLLVVALRTGCSRTRTFDADAYVSPVDRTSRPRPSHIERLVASSRGADGAVGDLASAVILASGLHRFARNDEAGNVW